MPRSINGISTGLQHIPEDGMIEVAGIHSRALNRGFGSERAKLDC
jgi:hypothetical protein